MTARQHQHDRDTPRVEDRSTGNPVLADARRPGPLAVFPGSSTPLPPLLLPIEAAKVLRLDVLTQPNGTEKKRATGDALKSLDHLVRTRRLQPRRFGKSRTFAARDVLALIDFDGQCRPERTGTTDHK